MGMVYLAEEGSFGLTFPYTEELVRRVKQLDGARFRKNPPHWLVSCAPESIPALVEFAAENGFEISQDAQARIATLPPAQNLSEENVALSLAQDAQLQVPGLGGQLLPFQRAAVAYALQNPRCIVGDEMGLGKTIEALAILEKRGSYPALVVCPASVKGMWHAKSREWLPQRAVITLGDRTDFGVSEIYVVNYEMLRKHSKFLLSKGWKAVIFDEFHYLKDPKSHRSKLSKQIAHLAPVILMLSGTPVLNRPIEIAHPLDILGILPRMGGYWKFAERYCDAKKVNVYAGYKTKKTKMVWSVKGHSHLDELHHRLRGLGYIRRNKVDVMPQLPPKRRTILPVPLQNRDLYERAERDVAHFLAKGNLQVEKRLRMAEALVRMEALKHLAAQGKIPAAIEWINDFFEEGDKLVVFAWHQDIVKQIADHFNAPMIRGDTPLKQRDVNVYRFQNDPLERLIVCNIQSGGLGITLTAASNSLFLELPWRPADLEQAEDRLHRIGQKDSVNAWYLLSQGTVEEEIWGLLVKKWHVVNAVTDGKEEYVQEDLMTEVMKILMKKYEEEQ